MPQWTRTNPNPEVLFSMEAMRRAWQFVRRNSSAAGTDGVRGEQFEAHLEPELSRLRRDIIGDSYRPQPVRQYAIPKPNGKQRYVSIWALRDRVAQRVVLEFLTPILEQKFLPCSYGFRPDISTDDAAAAVAQFRDTGRCWVLDTDIQDCFPSIDTNLLMQQVRRIVHSQVIKNLLQCWLDTPIQGRPAVRAGVSQGGVISPALANLYLHRFDEMTLAALPQSKLIRFADDFVILSYTEAEAAWSLEVSQRSLANLRLTLNMRKTRIIHFDEGFHFLGFAFVGKHTRKL